MPGVTITGNYGAGGSYVAPAVATALGLPMLDRAINTDVAAELHVSVEEAQAGERKRSFAARFFSILAPLSGGALGAGTDAAPPDADVIAASDSDEFREQSEAIMRKALASGAVIHGRAGAAAFRNDPDVLHVRLMGTTDARIAQGAALEHVSLQDARRAQPQVDHARAHYVRRLYNVDIEDLTLYDLAIDSTRLSLDTCTTLIVATYQALLADRRT